MPRCDAEFLLPVAVLERVLLCGKAMTRHYNERRNKLIWNLVEKRRYHPKDVPAEMERRGFTPTLTYENVRKIISLWRKIHSNSQAINDKVA